MIIIDASEAFETSTKPLRRRRAFETSTKIRKTSSRTLSLSASGLSSLLKSNGFQTAARVFGSAYGKQIYPNYLWRTSGQKVYVLIASSGPGIRNAEPLVLHNGCFSFDQHLQPQCPWIRGQERIS